MTARTRGPNKARQLLSHSFDRKPKIVRFLSRFLGDAACLLRNPARLLCSRAQFFRLLALPFAGAARVLCGHTVLFMDGTNSFSLVAVKFRGNPPALRLAAPQLSIVSLSLAALAQQFAGI